MKNKFKQLKHKGFTLLEMVFVIFIIALLMLLIIPNIASQKEHAANKTDEAFVTTIQGQVDLYDNGTPTLEQLKTDHYISEKQYKHAEEMGITINNGVVEQKK